MTKNKTVQSETTATDLSVILNDLQALQAKITEFQQLPCFDLLLRVSANLTVSLFIPTKDNSNPLNGKRDLFVASKFDHDLSVVNLPVLPDLDTMIADHNKIDVLDVTVRLKNAFLDSDTGKQYLDCKAIANSLSKIDLAVLTTQYKNFARVQKFLADTDPAMFEIPIWDREIVSKLSDVSQEVKNLFLQCHTKALNHFPKIVNKGVTLGEFDLTVANFSSYDSILMILGTMTKYNASKKDCVFWQHALNEFVVQYSKRADFDPFILCLFLRKFDSNAGSKQNLTQTTASFKDLFPNA